MRAAIAVLTLALIVSVAAANPVVYWPAAGITFDPTGNFLARVDPAAYTAGTVYIAVTCPQLPEHNVVTISFAVSVDAGVSAPASWSSLLPGGLAIGDYTTGITLSSTEPIYDAPVVVASASLFYLGVPGQIRLVDHPDYPRWITNGAGDVFYYCVASNGGVLMDPMPTVENCGWCDDYDPVENSSWGAIKAMYR